MQIYIKVAYNSVEIKLYHGIGFLQIFIHSTEEMAGLEQSAQHSWDRRVEKVSFSVKHTYTTEDARQLSIRQRRCVFADELHLETSNIYTYSACMRQCRMQLSRAFCKCVPHFYPQLSTLFLYVPTTT